MIYFAHAGHDHSEEAVHMVASQANSPNYGLYIGIAVGLSLLIISVVILAVAFKKKITS